MRLLRISLYVVRLEEIQNRVRRCGAFSVINFELQIECLEHRVTLLSDL